MATKTTEEHSEGAVAEAKELAADVVEAAGTQLAAKAGEVKEEAGFQVREQVDQRSTQAGEQVSALAQAFAPSVQRLRSEGNTSAADLVDGIADRADRLGSYLQSANADRLLGDVRSAPALADRRSSSARGVHGLAVREGVQRAPVPDGRRRGPRVGPIRVPAEHRTRERTMIAADRDGRSTAELVKDLSRQASLLVRQEIQLAKTEVAEKSKHAGVGAAALAAAAVAGLLAFGTLTAFLVLALDGVMPVWTAALIVGVLWAAAAVGFALYGRDKLDEVGTPVPEKTVETLKEDVEWLRHPTS